MTHSAIASATSSFLFNSFSVRAITKGDNIWFVAKDVCKALGITWSGATLKDMPKGWQGMLRFNTPSGNQQVRCISEPAVYKLAFRSNKPEADAFTNWVASDVLPTIRKTGQFAVKHDGRKALGKGLEEIAQRKPKALPPAAEPSFREKCAEVTAQMLALRGQVFRVSSKMTEVFRRPFWGPAGYIPEDKKPFADAMNYAILNFDLAVNKDLEAMELLFKAFVEGEKILNG